MKKLAVFFVLLAGTLWGCIGIFVRRYNAMGLSSMQTVAVRMVIAAILFALFVLGTALIGHPVDAAPCPVSLPVFSLTLFRPGAAPERAELPDGVYVIRRE